MCISHSPLKQQHLLLHVVSEHSTKQKIGDEGHTCCFKRSHSHPQPTLLRKSFKVCPPKIITPWVDSEAWRFGEDMRASIQGNVLNGLLDMSFGYGREEKKWS